MLQQECHPLMDVIGVDHVIVVKDEDVYTGRSGHHMALHRQAS